MTDVICLFYLLFTKHYSLTCITRILDKGIVSILGCWFANELLLFSWFACIIEDVGAGVSERGDTVSDGTEGSWVAEALVIISRSSRYGTALPEGG